MNANVIGLAAKHDFVGLFASFETDVTAILLKGNEVLADPSMPVADQNKALARIYLESGLYDTSDCH